MIADRVVQAALKLVLEPIFEADFLPCSYGFRPKRRAQDAIAEIHHYSTSPDAWGQFLALASVSTSASGTWTMSAGVVR